jgi:CRP/FNR family transcriptional regulator, anaerobic regulatory protein
VPLPFRQQDIADALGLSLVHTNKTLKALRAMKLVQWSDGKLKLDDLPALADLAMIELEKPMRRPLM